MTVQSAGATFVGHQEPLLAAVKRRKLVVTWPGTKPCREEELASEHQRLVWSSCAHYRSKRAMIRLRNNILAVCSANDNPTSRLFNLRHLEDTWTVDSWLSTHCLQTTWCYQLHAPRRFSWTLFCSLIRNISNIFMIMCKIRWFLHHYWYAVRAKCCQNKCRWVGDLFLADKEVSEGEMQWM